MTTSEPPAPKPRRRLARYLVPIVGLLAVIAALVGIKASQIGSLIKMGKEFEKSGPPPETVSTAVSQLQTWEGTLSAVGSITAAKGVSLSNDAPGVITRISFESGAVVREGQALVELDANVERAQLASAKARRDLATLTAGRSHTLAASNAIPQSQADNDDAQLRTATTDFTALQAQIDRKTVRAPFAGRLGIRNVNLGQYLGPGTPITQLEAIDTVYVDFTLPQQRLPDIKVGMPVRVTVESADHLALDGVIVAVEPQIDAVTRTIKARASVPNKQEKLRPGMFATVAVVLAAQPATVTVPATAILHASYGDSVFVVEDKKNDAGVPVQDKEGKPVRVARQQFVRLGKARGDFFGIADGVTAGQEVVTAGAFKLRNGASVVVNNAVKTNPELDPHPSNR